MVGSADQPRNEELAWPLGPYFILRQIGSGKFGIVYSARHVPSGRDVALKLIPEQGADGDEKVAAERHGAMLQQQFGRMHRGLVPEVFEHERIATFYAIAMELVHGQPLTDLIAVGPVADRRAATVALAISRFLEEAHRFATDVEGVHYALIVHGDLKPDHVLLIENDQIRVLDFGIAKALAARTLVTTNKWGSIQYASPERLQSDGHVNEQADFWSLGVMLFEMVSGYRPYRRFEQNAGRLDAAIRRQETPEPLRPGTDPGLVAIIFKLLAPQIERRYASARLIAQDLEAFLRGEPTVAAAEQARASQETVRISSRPVPPLPPLQPVALPPPTTATVPTEPLPRPGAESAAGQPAAAAAKPRRSWIVTRFLRLAAAALLMVMAAAEGVAMVRAERIREQVPALEPGDVSAVRAQYASIAGWAPLDIGLAMRLDDPLTNRMIELADRSILEFRTEAPAVAQVQWEQARECLDLAAQISPRRSRLRSRQAYVRGQLARINAGDRDRAGLDLAIREFQEAARLDPQSPDPYLGLARVYAYAMWDVEALAEAIGEAAERGYTPGRRERAQLGDAYRVRGERTRAAALRLHGEERAEQLARAEEAFAKCVEYFDGLRFFSSEDNLRTCRRRLDAIAAELHPQPPPEIFLFPPPPTLQGQ